MPLSTMNTSGQLAAKRIAQDAFEAAGECSWNMVSTRSGSFASVPPLTGSMTTTFLPCFTAVS